MTIEPITLADLTSLAHLQPPDWPDIFPNIKFYIESSFCNPIKVLINNKLVGIGSTIEFKNTAWLAHIIVDLNYRNQGIGAKIVESLIESIDRKKISSILLIATPLGEPVYIKAGFRKVSDYIFFKRDELYNQLIKSEKIVPFMSRYYKQILELDKAFTGEDRSMLFENHLINSHLYVERDSVFGFYLSTLGEGPIIANTSEAGLALMNFKVSFTDKVILPIECSNGINFLKQNGFKEFKKASRMILGDDIHWQPQGIYCRIGGNFG
jgi:N-acetylglutamate synthase-like GNAT family acetyltransferase